MEITDGPFAGLRVRSSVIVSNAAGPVSVETLAALTFEKQDAGWTTTGIKLSSTVKAPGADRQKIEAAAQGAKDGCPISRLLKTNITLELKIEV